MSENIYYLSVLHNQVNFIEHSLNEQLKNKEVIINWFISTDKMKFLCKDALIHCLETNNIKKTNTIENILNSSLRIIETYNSKLCDEVISKKEFYYSDDKRTITSQGDVFCFQLGRDYVIHCPTKKKKEMFIKSFDYKLYSLKDIAIRLSILVQILTVYNQKLKVGKRQKDWYCLIPYLVNGDIENILKENDFNESQLIACNIIRNKIDGLNISDEYLKQIIKHTFIENQIEHPKNLYSENKIKEIIKYCRNYNYNISDSTILMDKIKKLNLDI